MTHRILTAGLTTALTATLGAAGVLGAVPAFAATTGPPSVSQHSATAIPMLDPEKPPTTPASVRIYPTYRQLAHGDLNLIYLPRNLPPIFHFYMERTITISCESHPYKFLLKTMYKMSRERQGLYLLQLAQVAYSKDIAHMVAGQSYVSGATVEYLPFVDFEVAKWNYYSIIPAIKDSGKRNRFTYQSRIGGLPGCSVPLVHQVERR